MLPRMIPARPKYKSFAATFAQSRVPTPTTCLFTRMDGSIAIVLHRRKKKNRSRLRQQSLKISDGKCFSPTTTGDQLLHLHQRRRVRGTSLLQLYNLAFDCRHLLTFHRLKSLRQASLRHIPKRQSLHGAKRRRVFQQRLQIHP